jgi:hypothetical protein
MWLYEVPSASSVFLRGSCRRRQTCQPKVQGPPHGVYRHLLCAGFNCSVALIVGLLYIVVQRVEESKDREATEMT